MTAKQFAIKNGFVDVKPLPPWRGYTCWKPVLFKDADPFLSYYTGVPLIILEKNGKFRITNYEESMQYQDDVYVAKMDQLEEDDPEDDA